jgi:hypothetical protein
MIEDHGCSLLKGGKHDLLRWHSALESWQDDWLVHNSERLNGDRNPVCPGDFGPLFYNRETLKKKDKNKKERPVGRSCIWCIYYTIRYWILAV